jgi:hypothetical protein
LEKTQAGPRPLAFIHTTSKMASFVAERVKHGFEQCRQNFRFQIS